MKVWLNNIKLSSDEYVINENLISITPESWNKYSTGTGINTIRTEYEGIGINFGSYQSQFKKGKKGKTIKSWEKNSYWQE